MNLGEMGSAGGRVDGRTQADGDDGMNDPVCHKNTETHVMFHCPGCECAHGVTVNGQPNAMGASWGWNGDLIRPTFTPSILVRGTVPITDEERDRIMAGEPFEPAPVVCHSFVRDGKIEFLSDCTHKLAGQTVPLETWDEI